MKWGMDESVVRRDVRGMRRDRDWGIWTVANRTLTTPIQSESPWYTGTTDEYGRTGRAGQALANPG